MPSTQPQFSPEQIAAVKNYRKIEELMPSHWLESFVKANGLRHRSRTDDRFATRPAVNTTRPLPEQTTRPVFRHMKEQIATFASSN